MKTPCIVSQDLNRYMEKCDREDRWQMWAERRSEEMRDDWLEELDRTGRIVDLWLTRPELEEEAQATEKPVLEYLLDEAYDLIEQDPGEYQPEPDYSLYEWD